MIKKYNK